MSGKITFYTGYSPRQSFITDLYTRRLKSVLADFSEKNTAIKIEVEDIKGLELTGIRCHGGLRATLQKRRIDDTPIFKKYIILYAEKLL